MELRVCNGVKMMLPNELDSAILLIFDGPESDWDRKLIEITDRHPELAAAIRERARTIQGQFEAESAAPAADGPQSGRALPSNDRVQSTATQELLARLEQAPRLDAQRYQLHGEVDRGGMGAIERIHDRHLNRLLAMKVMLDREPARSMAEKQIGQQILGRFLEEAQVTSQLDHPGVVPVHELGLDQTGRVYFTMRLVKGRTAQAVFRESFGGSAEWPLTRALEVILKVCDTMAFAHDKGVLHRDLKPGNVMVGGFGEVYVMDWGLAKLRSRPDRHDLRIRPRLPSNLGKIDPALGDAAADDELPTIVTMDGQRVGTPSYMSPQQARGEPLDVQADVYAIGAMLYELLAQRPPYTTAAPIDPYAILREVERGPPERIEDLQSSVPAELVAICDKAMARDLTQRYPDTMALAADVRAFLAQRAVQAYRTGPLVELKLWVRRNRSLAASFAAIVLLAFGAAAVTVALSESRQRELENLAHVLPNLALKALDRAEQPWLPTDGSPGRTAAAMRSWVATWSADVDALTASAARPETRTGPAPLGARWQRATAELQNWPDRFERRLRLLEQQRDLWDRCSDALAEHPSFVGLELRPQSGLVPLGPDLGRTLVDGSFGYSGPPLWAFFVVGTGEVPRWLDDDGKEQPLGRPGRAEFQPETGLVMVLLPAGTYYRGARKTTIERLQKNTVGETLRSVPALLADIANPANGNVPLDPDAGRRTLPVLQIEVPSIFVAKCEVTIGQYQRSPGASRDAMWGGSRQHPQGMLTQNEAIDYAAWAGLRLPSESEWEYACRAGTRTPVWTGDLETARGTFVIEKPPGRTVGTTKANPFGLHDVHGNVYERCLDAWNDDYVNATSAGPRLDGERGFGVVRGGSWYRNFKSARSAFRGRHQYDERRSDIGVRLVRDVER